MLCVWCCMVKYWPATSTIGKFMSRALWVIDLLSNKITPACDVLFYERRTLAQFRTDQQAGADLALVLALPAGVLTTLRPAATVASTTSTVSQSRLPRFLARLRSLRRGSAARCPSLLLVPPHHGSLPDPALGRMGPLPDHWPTSGALLPDCGGRLLPLHHSFPLAGKADVLKPWLLARCGAQGLCGLRLHSDHGGEFSSTRLETFCQGRGIIQSYTLPASPQQNGVAKQRIGLVMEVARTSMCHASAPQFLWPQAVRYAAHQLNMCPSDARPRVMPVSLWTGSLGVATDFRVWGSLAHDCALSANKLSPRTCACVFLGFPLDASGWVFYDPVTYEFFASQDVMFDESHPLPPSRPAPSGVSHITPHSSPPQRLVPVVSGGTGGAVAEGEGTGAPGVGGVGFGGAGGVGVEVTPVEDTAASSRRFHPASPHGLPSVLQFPPRCRLLWSMGVFPREKLVAPGVSVVKVLVLRRLLRLEKERERFEKAKQQQQQEQSQSQQQE
ncbi:unnamed protein product [Closterium sp. NIES-54]